MEVELRCEDFREAIVTGKDFVLPHPKFCDLYFSCTPNTDLPGVPYQGQMGICEEGKAFDSIDGYECEAVNEVSCSEREIFHNQKTGAMYFAIHSSVVRKVLLPDVGVPSYSDYCLELNGLFEVPNECPKYVECHHGKVKNPFFSSYMVVAWRLQRLRNKSISEAFFNPCWYCSSKR